MTRKSFWQEAYFWSALAAGPVCWMAMVLTGVPLNDLKPTWQTILLVAFIYPVLEEYVFRGGLQASLYTRPGLSRSVAGVSLANIVTSMAFAAIHLFNHSPIWAILIFFPSLVFGWMRDRYEMLHASIILHIAYNAGFVWLFA